jgi:methionine-S-sulfoxide reductase
MVVRTFAAMCLLLSVSIAATADQDEQTGTETAILAGGCFWCMEADYEKLDGVLEVVSGYAGGHLEHPTYKQVSSGQSGHLEVVRITYDANKTGYKEILDFFWRHVDPTRDDGQFCDRGSQYRPAIFYQNEKQFESAVSSRNEINASKPFSEPLKVEILKAGKFYPAEEYHQDYYRKNPIRYSFYRFNCGRDARIEQLWGQH